MATIDQEPLKQALGLSIPDDALTASQPSAPAVAGVVGGQTKKDRSAEPVGTQGNLMTYRIPLAGQSGANSDLACAVRAAQGFAAAGIPPEEVADTLIRNGFPYDKYDGQLPVGRETLRQVGSRVWISGTGVVIQATEFPRLAQSFPTLGFGQQMLSSPGQNFPILSQPPTEISASMAAEPTSTEPVSFVKAMLPPDSDPFLPSPAKPEALKPGTEFLPLGEALRKAA